MKNLVALKMSFFVFAAVSLAVHLLIIDLRYRWFLNNEESRLLSIIYSVCIIFIILLWTFYPSRILTAIIAFLSYLLPPVIDGDTFVSIDLKLMVFVVPSILLFLLATELRISITKKGAWSRLIARPPR